MFSCDKYDLHSDYVFSLCGGHGFYEEMWVDLRQDVGVASVTDGDPFSRTILHAAQNAVDSGAWPTGRRGDGDDDDDASSRHVAHVSDQTRNA